MNENQPKIVVEVKNLSKSFKNQLVLKNINLKIHQKSLHALIGENGAGKTTLIKSILGLYDNFSGEIKINQIRNSEPESRKKVFYFSAHPKFPTFLNMQQYLKVKYNLYETKMSNINNDLITYLKHFNLWNHRKKRIGTLSSGQKKKVLIVEALLFKADFWILDEPTANLDPNTRREIYSIISEQIEKNGTTVLISTHNLAEISPHATEATFIFDGKVFWNSLLNKQENLEKHYFRLLNDQLTINN